MNYEEAVAYIEDIPRFTTKNSLDHTRECLRRLGDPQRKFRVIHVAGTNGKGSTCAFITSVLREAGYSCGLFTSPHLVEINERFQINEEVIDDDTFLCAFEKVKKLSDELPGWIRPSTISFSRATRAISRRIGSKADNTTASGVSCSTVFLRLIP